MTGRNEKLLLLVGQLNYAWTNTESLLIYVIAHLMATSKDAAIVTFLTLNTTRARLDLIERLAKLSSTSAPDHEAVIDIANRMKHAARLRNKFNHCIYAFDENGEIESTQLMRIADFPDNLRYGKVESIDEKEMKRMSETIADIVVVNRSLWKFITDRRIEV
jgi:hypothetical protein